MTQRSSDVKADVDRFKRVSAKASRGSRRDTSAGSSEAAGSSEEVIPRGDAEPRAPGIESERIRAPASPAPPPATAADALLGERVQKLERQNVRMKFSTLGLVVLVGYLAFGPLVSENIVVKQTLVESKELKLIDTDGNPRLFLRMYSRVPVLQLLDRNGKPRMSLGMRFDDTPFIDLSDKTGRTRATLELTEGDEPALRLFNADGEPTFNIN